ncbi:GTPase Era [Pontibacter sp. BT310]|uniref:GTPase Era n=1 Tax=Pontibacter populi TaxID=890055 RepID=A0ABS6XFI1_9BACT|nr:MULTISPECIES: GTPase Era [Pontibacter]MBJ6119880.1 GTPase Era [Pontibacter sp. BT310]MBR0572309.1 GTPase Era [Microvirga sp. STS03]MBW3366733.1 GTPase Era [Pontibacter populi]
MAETPHKAGFVSIVGKPNVGKSTLMNALVGEKLSIITSKAQTTRHRIMGILNGDDFQIVYSDTPGIIKPQYALHESMMSFVRTSLEDADVILFVTDIYEQHDEDDVIKRLQYAEVPILLLINKIDQATEEEVQQKVAYWQEKMNPTEIHPISALHIFGLDQLFARLLHYLPEHPAFYPKDELTDKPERFFVSEIIREKIFLNYKKEIPYSCEVVVEEFKEEEEIIRIRAEISVERKSQKGIVIGNKGEALKKVGTHARIDMEQFFQKKIFLDLYVRVNENWRTDQKLLRRFGYSE